MEQNEKRECIEEKNAILAAVASATKIPRQPPQTQENVNFNKSLI